MFKHGEDVAAAFVDHFRLILGENDYLVNLCMHSYVGNNRVSLSKILVLIRPISNKDIRMAMFDIGNDKAPGSDGFPTKFFKVSWSVIGEICRLWYTTFFILLSLRKS